MAEKKLGHIYHNLLYLTQIGMSMAVPPVLSLMLANWLKERFELGNWIMILGIVFGIGGMVTNLLEYVRIFSARAKKETPEPISYNKRY